MGSSEKKQKACLNSSAAVLHALVFPATAAAVTGLAKKSIDAIQQFEAPSDVKDFATTWFTRISSAVNIGAVAESVMPWSSAYYKAFPHLSPKEHAVVAFTAVVGIASSIYSLTQFGVPSHVVEAGTGATLGATSFRLSQALATKFSVDNQGLKGPGLLNNDSLTMTGLDSNNTGARPF